MSRARYALAFAIIALFTLALPRAGRADWAYTEWGMSLDEVIAASPVKLTPLDEKVQAQTREYISDGRSAAMLAGWHVEGAYTYIVLFYFDLETRKLVSANLDLRTMSLADQLLSDLTEKYGAPVESREIVPGFFSSVWEEADNRIVFIRTFDTAKMNYSAR
ncbi:hypothetical protein [Dongia sp.]|uniref:hypothetical protein n=1 Tax=Dongia sp. TaxID=1977262 RepID=UPI0034A1A491